MSPFRAKGTFLAIGTPRIIYLLLPFPPISWYHMIIKSKYPAQTYNPISNPLISKVLERPSKFTPHPNIRTKEIHKIDQGT